MSALITEAHRKLRETLEIRWMRATELELEAELAAEKARLDWLEKRGPWESWNGIREIGITLRENIRADIDAAMKEDGA